MYQLMEAGVRGLGDELCMCESGAGVSLCPIVSPQKPDCNTENSKQIFPEKKFPGLSPDFHIHVPVSDLYIPTIGLPILLQENMWTDPGYI